MVVTTATKCGTPGHSGLEGNMSYDAFTSEKLLELGKHHTNESNDHLWQRAALFRAFNSRQPVLSLPDELVLKIFLDYRTICTSNSEYYHRNLDPTTWWWLVPTHVCNRWRTTSLTNPLFWSLVDNNIFSRRSLLKEALLRSREAPLDVSIDEDSPRHLTKFSLLTTISQGEALEMILKESYRICSLGWSLQILPPIDTIIRPFTRLETLRINAVPSHESAATTIASMIFQTMPCFLRRVRLFDVPLDWGKLGTLPPTIIELTIKFPPSNLIGTCEGVLNMLERLPRLEYLFLNQIPIKYQAMNKTVNLPHLKELTLCQSESCSVLSLVPSLSFPPTTVASIRVDYSSDDALPPAFPYSILSKFGFSQPLGKVEAQDDTRIILHFDTMESVLSFRYEADDSGPRPTYFSFVVEGDDLPHASPWLDFLEAISLSVYPHAIDIYMGGLYAMCSEDFFAQTMLRAINLEKLKIEHEDALQHLPAALRVLDDGTVPMAKLRKINIMPQEDDDYSYGRVDGANLCAILDHRLEKGVKLQRLKVYDPELIHFKCCETRTRLTQVVDFVVDK